ncbi:MAG: hypothetical protein IKM74_02320 [Bacteroidales bacterium]|nr:hypothetical protein [Bacteroidales bacterium]
MLNFIIFKGSAEGLVRKLIDIQMKYSFDPVSQNVNDNIRDFCREVERWIEESLDISFSYIQWVIQNCNEVISSKYDIPKQAFVEVCNFVNNVKTYWILARSEDDWPSCKQLLNLSPKEIIEMEKDLIKDDRLKQAIKQVLNLDTALDVINVVTLADYYSCLLASIKHEIWKCSEDILKNKQRLLLKFEMELGYCRQVLLKIGHKALFDKYKEMIEGGRHVQNDYWYFCIAHTQLF